MNQEAGFRRDPHPLAPSPTRTPAARERGNQNPALPTQGVALG
jgi:hypothetical protein